jgi:hypothetical protein
MIPIGTVVTATVQATAMKKVRCEFCHAEYFYKMYRMVQSQSSNLLFIDGAGAKSRAANAAAKALKSRLEKGCEPVSCPSCGCYQTNMIARLRRKKFTWLLIAAPILAFAAIIMRGVMDPPRGSKVPTVVLFTLAGCSVALWLFKRVTYSPNFRAQDRLQRDACHKEGGLTLEEFEKMKAEQAKPGQAA